jgi:DNA-binding GntR family transcriptional regulator
VEAGDGDAAADEMARHLRTLRPVYERVWLHG